MRAQKEIRNIFLETGDKESLLYNARSLAELCFISYTKPRICKQ